MPQMMPLSWITLFAVFSTTLIIFASTNYFTSTLKPKHTTKKAITKKMMNWKW
uniref:ATP synthase complex subunit 8 n=1 Tax=Bifiditermes nr. madagascariensis TaxID=2942751 RepID=A0A8X8RH88_9NEOP|nr:ATP synthase F0 subunit 8 [Bifiditermes nr. madagascariensis]